MIIIPSSIYKFKKWQIFYKWTGNMTSTCIKDLLTIPVLSCICSELLKNVVTATETLLFQAEWCTGKSCKLTRYKKHNKYLKKILGRVDRVMPFQIFSIGICVAQIWEWQIESTFWCLYMYAIRTNTVRKDFTIFWQREG